MTKKREVIQSIKSMTKAALEKSMRDAEKETMKIRLEQKTQKGSKDLHLYLKKRKEIAAMKTIAGLSGLEGGQDGQG